MRKAQGKLSRGFPRSQKRDLENPAPRIPTILPDEKLIKETE